jgi:hypothetical protein
VLARYLALAGISAELLAWMDLASKRLDEGYRGAPIPKLKEGFAEARRKLLALARR